MLKQIFIYLAVLVEVTLQTYLERTIEKSGFHRDLITSLQISEADLPPKTTTDCRLLFVDVIPSGAYIDPYQLADLHQFGVPDVLVSDTVDVEKPEFFSKSFTVFVFVGLSHSHGNWTANYTLPIHLRYHAVSDQKYAFVTFSIPKVAVHCTVRETGKAYTGFQEKAMETINTSCHYNSHDVCEWTTIDYNVDYSVYTATVPVGQSDHCVFVTVATLLTTLIGCCVHVYQTVTLKK